MIRYQLDRLLNVQEKTYCRRQRFSGCEFDVIICMFLSAVKNLVEIFIYILNVFLFFLPFQF